MAKWGEGDPRWIVEERPDATNVNNWHWSEKNASAWSKEKLMGLFIKLEFNVPDVGTAVIKSVSKCEGEATVNNRKGKLIFFYDWNIQLDWNAKDSDENVSGTIEIPNLCEEHKPHEVDINVSVSEGGLQGDKVKEFIRHEGTALIHEKISEYVSSLQDEYASDLILPTKDRAQTKSSAEAASLVSSSTKSYAVNTSELQQLNIGTKISTSKIQLKQTFKCRADEIYRVLTVQEMIVAFTRCDVKIKAEKGGHFEMFGGNVSGFFDELIPNKKVVQKWRFKAWPSGHYSIVTFEINQLEDCTEVRMIQTGVPSSDVDRTKEGWKRNYWERIKSTFGFAAQLI